jgi:hypothetical protein
MRAIGHCRYGGEMSIERDDIDDPLEFLSFAKTQVRRKFATRPVGGMVGRYMWQEIWSRLAVMLDTVGEPAPEWLLHKEIPLVRDRFMAADMVHLFTDGIHLRGRIWSMANGARVVREIEARRPGRFFLAADGKKSPWSTA